MFQAFFNSLSGLFSFSQGLDTISNNVSNMNTPGFRGSDSFFRSIGGYGGQTGYGSEVDGTRLRLAHGDLRQTGNAGDLALNGAGFFILRDDSGSASYTRAGQFHFDEDGYFVGPDGNSRVAGIDASGNLADINISDLRTLPPVATTEVDISGNISPSDGTASVQEIKVYDAQGESHTLKLVLTDNSANTPNSWTVDITDADGNVVGSGEVRFAADGTPQAGFNTVDATLSVNGNSQTVTFSFGDPGAFDGTTQFAGSASDLGADVVDGRSLVGLQSYSFDDSGTLQLKYSNGETREGPQVALAYFADESELREQSGSLFTAPDTLNPEIGRAGKDKFGKVVGSSLELSNVDLTKEFADMIIIQRGYQASAKVMNVANGLIEQLYNNTRQG